jgi:hypothetical protein
MNRRTVSRLITLAVTTAFLTGCERGPVELIERDGTFADTGLRARPELVLGKRTTFSQQTLLMVEVRGSGSVRTGHRKQGAVEAYDYRTEQTSRIPDLPVILHCDRGVLRTEDGGRLAPVPARSTCTGTHRMQTGAGRDLPVYLVFEAPKVSGRVVLAFELPVEVVAPEEDEWRVARERIGLYDEAHYQAIRKESVPPLLGPRQATTQIVVRRVPTGSGILARVIDALP